MKKKLVFYFLHEFFGSLDFARGLFVLFLISKGMSMAEVGILQTLLFWSNIVFEVPAGILADKIKRKYSIFLGLILIAIAALIIPFSHSFVMFALVFVLHGMGFAFRSGADTALLFDELKASGPKWSEKFVSLSAKSRSLVNIGLILAMASGGFIQGAFGWKMVYFFFAAAMLVSAVFVLLIKEGVHETQDTSVEDSSALKDIFQSAKIFLRSPKGKRLSFFIFGMGFLEATHAPFFIYIQSYFKEMGLVESKISLVIAASMSLTSIGYLFVERLGRFKFSSLVTVTSLLLAGLIAIFLTKPSLMVGIALFAVIDMLPALIFVHSDEYINNKIPTDIRASMLSVHSFVSSIFISFAFLGGGKLLDIYSANQVLGSLFVLPILGALLLGVYFKTRPKEET